MTSFFSLHRDELSGFLEGRGILSIHTHRLMAAAYHDLLDDPRSVPGLPRRFHEVADELSFDVPEIASAHLSQYDGSVKFLLRYRDGERVEAVLMPEKARLTLCLSSQVGCRQACTFCHTGRMGLIRQLTTAEIVGEIVVVNRWLKEHPEWIQANRLPRNKRITNIVFMGMGEPLDNVDAVIKALGILTDHWAFGLSMKRIAVSSAGHLDGMKRLFAAYPKASLALSVHATSEGERSRLMPINRRYPLGDVLAFLRGHYAANNPDGTLLIQYTVINGVNDSDERAHALCDLLEGLPAKVNLIPLNEVEPSRFRSPDPSRLERLRDVIHHRGVRVMIRYSKGQDIGAACGQLVVNQ